MIAGIFLSLVVTALPIIAGIVYARAVAATTSPPMVWRECSLPKLPALSMPAEPEPPAADEWDALMADVRWAIESGRLRL